MLDRLPTRIVLAVGAVAAATLALQALAVDRSVSALVYVVVVLAASLLGPCPAALAVAAAVAAQSYYFNPPVHSFRITKVDDFVAIAVFGITAGVTSAAVARISELRRRAESRAAEARRELERARRLDREATAARVEAAAEQSRAAFLSSMTHNLRTPLASIKASIATLRSEGASLPLGSRDRLLETAGTQTERLERLVTKVLVWSRVQSGVVVAEPERVDLIDLCSDALHLVGSLTAGRCVRLDASDAAPVVEADPTLVSLALSCLIENALRYAPCESPIVVRADYVDGQCALSVIDRGPGVPIAERERIFEQFARGDGVDDATGTGLGLPIARAYTAVHDGRIDVAETPGGGATFTIRFPARTDRG